MPPWHDLLYTICVVEVCFLFHWLVGRAFLWLDRKWVTRADLDKTCQSPCRREVLRYWKKTGGHLDDPYP